MVYTIHVERVKREERYEVDIPEHAIIIGSNFVSYDNDSEYSHFIDIWYMMPKTNN